MSSDHLLSFDPQGDGKPMELLYHISVVVLMIVFSQYYVVCLVLGHVLEQFY